MVREKASRGNQNALAGNRGARHKMILENLVLKNRNDGKNFQQLRK